MSRLKTAVMVALLPLWCVLAMSPAKPRRSVR